MTVFSFNRRTDRRPPSILIAFAFILAVTALVNSCDIIGADRLTRLARSSLAQIQGEIDLAGLQQDVEILRDQWGIAHIYANTVEDLFFAQGFVAAQDRLWQLEIWRRVGQGQLAEIAGPVAFERDRMARLLRYRGDMEAEWASYHPDGQRIITAFTKGVNAFIEHNADNLPVEFQLTGVIPQPWTPDVPLLRMAGLPMTQNGRAEIQLALLVEELGLAEANRRDGPDPWHQLQIPRGLEVSTVPREVLYVLQAGYAAIPGIPVLEEHQNLVDEEVDDRTMAGSNNWVVSGEMSATGLPLLANDPHRRLMLPSLRYLVHLNGPGWNVIGAGEPALPGVAIGHNERIAWGLTIVGIDQQDIFVERVNPQNRNEVWWANRWEPLTIEVDTIFVKGEGPRVIELKFSRHGPIVFEDTVHNRAYAFRSVLAEPGTAGYLGSLRVDQATNWEEYLEAMDHWLVPSENMIYADVDGNIGWQAAGLTPIRCCGWVGRLPVPATDRHQWRGFRPMSELPREFNPPRGYITTANHNIMPESFTPALGYNWSSPVRYERLDDVLSDSGDFTVADFKRLQHDVYSSVARQALAPLRDWAANTEKIERARQLLAAWDARLDRDSPAAALFKMWRSLLERNTSGPPVPSEQLDSLMELALASAIDTLELTQGEDWSKWTWGAMHTTLFRHPVTASFDLPAVERSGDRTTVNLTGQHGASFREIIDLSNWDNSVATTVPGQSGQPESPHYDDHLQAWADGEYFPLLFTRLAIEENTQYRLVLKATGR
jgi:penicillin amidase